MDKLPSDTGIVTPSLPSYETVIQKQSTYYYIHHIHSTANLRRTLNVDLCSGDPNQFNGSAVIETVFHTNFSDTGFSIHRGKDRTAPLVALVSFRIEDPIGADIDLKAAGNLIINADDLKANASKERDQTGKNYELLLRVQGTNPLLFWKILVKSRSAADEEPRELSSSSLTEVSNPLDYNFDLIDDTGFVYATYFSQYVENQKSGDGSARRWGYLKLFGTAETSQTAFTDQVIVSLLSILEMNMKLHAPGHRVGEHITTLAKKSALLCTVM